MRVFLLFTLMTYCVITAFGQSEYEVYLAARNKQSKEYTIKEIGIVLRKYNPQTFIEVLKPGEGFITSVAISINKKGRVDTVYYPKDMSPSIKKLLTARENILTSLRKVNNPFFFYKDKIIIIPMFFDKAYNESLTNLDEINANFLDFWPDIPDNNKRPIELFKPMIQKLHVSYEIRKF